MVDETAGNIIKIDLDCQLLKLLAGTGTMFCYVNSDYYTGCKTCLIGKDVFGQDMTVGSLLEFVMNVFK